ncbi:hypothetical protein AX15_002042 [Amanita polypyramis BW_CC]|nr:hypothetical protein AX15_002042 [Amanita polypyramis BW_CC]
MSPSQRNPYTGPQKKLIIAFDVGVVSSFVSYVLLTPGEVPVIQPVTRFPGQKSGSDSATPSVVCYNESGGVVAVGSEADLDTNPDLGNIAGLVRVEWFKLHLRSSHPVAEQGFNMKPIPPLPPNKTAIDVLADFLRYLYQSTKQYIRDRTGSDIWESVHTNIEFVLCHPNDWEGKQQSEMRRAAIVAGLVVNETDTLKRTSFVTEGEASLHFCLDKTPTTLETHANDGLMVLVCGDSMIEISTYTQSPTGQFIEIAPIKCLLQGSLFVKFRAQAFLTEKLRRSRYGTPEDIEVMTTYFDKVTRLSFKDPSMPYFIRFGRNTENDPEFDIRCGLIKIKGSQIAEFFEPTVRSIIQVIGVQCRNSAVPIKTVFLVGNFATSDYLFSKLEDLKPGNINIVRPDGHPNRTISEGAIEHYINRQVPSASTQVVTHPSSLSQIHHPDSIIKQPKRNNEFYVDCTFVIIRVEDELFKLPRYVFTKHSPVFRDIFDVEVSYSSESNGSSDERPLVLEGIKAPEFIRLLRCIWPTESGGKASNTSLEDWQAVLKLATLYEMTEAKALAIEHMSPLLEKSPSLQIHLAKVHNVQEWLTPGFYELVRRKNPLDENDVQLIGLTDALKVMSVREDRKFDSDSRENYICRHKSDFPFSINDDEFRRRFDLYELQCSAVVRTVDRHEE